MVEDKGQRLTPEQVRTFLLEQIDAIKVDAKRASDDSVGALEIAGDLGKDVIQQKLEAQKLRIVAVINNYCWHLSMLLLIFLFSTTKNEAKKERLLQRLIDLIQLPDGSIKRVFETNDPKELRSASDEFYQKWDQIRKQIRREVETKTS